MEYVCNVIYVVFYMDFRSVTVLLNMCIKKCSKHDFKLSAPEAHNTKGQVIAQMGMALELFKAELDYLSSTN